jgi:hypothetical protein
MTLPDRSAPRIPAGAFHLDSLHDDARLGTQAVLVLSGRSRSSLGRDIEAGRWPAPIRLPGSHLRYWRAADVRRALAEVAQCSDK